MKLKVNQNYVLSRFYTCGEEDTFDYFYYRNNNVFARNSFYEQVNLEWYDDEKYPNVERHLIDAKVITEDCFVLPKGVHDLIVLEDGTWELNVNGVVMNIVNLLNEESWSYEPTRKNIMSVIYQ